MACKVVWTRRSQNDLENIFDYLINSWGISIAEDFSLKLSETEEFISHHPTTSRLISSTKSIYRIRITKQNALYYRLKNNLVEVITIFDTRQNPKKLKL